MKKKRIIKILAMLLIATRIFTSVGVVAGDTEEYGVIQVTEDNTYEKTKFYKDSIFGIAGGFHLVGFESVKTAAHTNGNILTNNLTYVSNFGTNPEGYKTDGTKHNGTESDGIILSEITYAKKITNAGSITATPYKDSVLVVGQGVIIGTADNGNAWTINGQKVTAPDKSKSSDSLWQDTTDQKFLDIEKVKRDTKALSKRLSEKADNITSIVRKSDNENNQTITVSGSGDYSVYNIKEGDFNYNNPIRIKGFNPDKASTLIINVDIRELGNPDTFTIPNSVAHYTDDTTVSTGEVVEWSNANVIWNIYDSKSPDNIFTGTIENKGAVTASILAPGATVNLSSNLNGTVIAKDITVSAESHRDDYSGDLKLTDFIDEDPENPGDTDPEGTDPEGTDPEGTDPEGTDPEGTDPEGTDPEGTDPEGTDPEGTDPEGTDPEGTDPEETDPGETDPEETDSTGEDPTDEDSIGEDPTDEDSTEGDSTEEDPTEEDDVTSNDKTSGVTDLKLGDNSSIILWIALMIVSLTGLITILFKKKKKTLG